MLKNQQCLFITTRGHVCTEHRSMPPHQLVHVSLELKLELMAFK